MAFAGVGLDQPVDQLIHRRMANTIELELPTCVALCEAIQAVQLAAGRDDRIAATGETGDDHVVVAGVEAVDVLR
jgi:hypothetical protein